MRLGTDATYNRPLSGALDEAYIYASALDASAVAVLYDDVTAAPTVTDAPTGDFFEGSLVAYYPFDYPFDDFLRDAAGAHHAWLLGESPAAAVQPVGKDRGGALLVGDAGFLELPAAVTEDLGRDYDRTICVLARVDSWAGAPCSSTAGPATVRAGTGASTTGRSGRASAARRATTAWRRTTTRRTSPGPRLDPSAATSPRKRTRSATPRAWSMMKAR